MRQVKNRLITMKTKVAKKVPGKKKVTARKAPAQKRAKSKAFGWTEKNISDYCGLLASGLGITNIGNEQGFPHPTSVYRKMADDAEFATRIARARECQQESEMDHCIKLADAATPEDYNVKKLQIWARQWRASKLAPKRYGDKLDITTRDETPPVTRDSMVAMLRGSKALLAEYESMIAEAKAPAAKLNV